MEGSEMIPSLLIEVPYYADSKGSTSNPTDVTLLLGRLLDFTVELLYIAPPAVSGLGCTESKF